MRMVVVNIWGYRLLLAGNTSGRAEVLSRHMDEI